ncbi:MAG: hypothetical protein C5B50_25460 [Verrucomicrobia bacterium]|nr:MAG: hypothetical protein C5B50_25460 [Verrucomicrobiota bacterium]
MLALARSGDGSNGICDIIGRVEIICGGSGAGVGDEIRPVMGIMADERLADLGAVSVFEGDGNGAAMAGVRP